MSGEDTSCLFAGQGYLQTVAKIASEWGRFDGQEFSRISQRFVQNLWNQLINPQCGDVNALPNSEPEAWHDAAMQLLSIADSAAASVGFFSQPNGSFPLADFVLDEYTGPLLKNEPRELTQLPYSLCSMVPPEEACVLPKTRTAQVGCTLRSWSHHLALLPPRGEVTTSWLFGANVIGRNLTECPEHQTLNLLFVPFPYRIDGSCFQQAGPTLGGGASDDFANSRRQSRFFNLSQDWLVIDGQKLTAKVFAGFLRELINEASKDCPHIDGIVLPELALDHELARQTAEELARNTTLEFFISGIADQQEGLVRNGVYSCLYYSGKILTDWIQTKHHRWKLDRYQIERYRLTDRLHPQASWWEHIDIKNRECAFYVFGDGLSLATLVCEDLARIDPVQSVIRSVGPNLVVALLMDGPQLKERWGARYATVLADDPGSAVLVLTSMGFPRRQFTEDAPHRREVVLWKGAEGTLKSATIQPNNHALLLTLTTVAEISHTLDGRSCDGTTFGLCLSEIRQVAHQNPPDWAANP
jgi:hypothetical protein